jgi:hypothetical protein
MQTLNLSGLWDVGLEQNYTQQVRVPGLATDPGQPTPGVLWYRRELTLPPGAWTHALLQLKGARFCPQVFINGTRVSQAPGGMTETRHPLSHPALQPGPTVTLEIALTSLMDVPKEDASCIPPADRWRSNLSSCLWDEVCLLVGGAEVWQRPAVTFAGLLAPDVKHHKPRTKCLIPRTQSRSSYRLRMMIAGEEGFVESWAIISLSSVV